MEPKIKKPEEEVTRENAMENKAGRREGWRCSNQSGAEDFM